MWCGVKMNHISLWYWYFAEPGDYVAREGEPVDGLYIILDGQVKFMQILTFVGSMHTYTT
jgi:hypothetical protein